MFSVLFEVHPRSEQRDKYLGLAKMLKPELERVDGFVENIRYSSLTRDGWLLSLSGWRDEKAVVRWRTQMHHHETQLKGREVILLDYHLRVGEVVVDTKLPEGQSLQAHRLDETEVGRGTAAILIDAPRSGQLGEQSTSAEVAAWLGRPEIDAGLVSWDVFEAVLTPGNLILLMYWTSESAAVAFERSVKLPEHGRFRRIRVVRDYGMFDRREAPQYYPDVPSTDSTRA
jgi:heme-degrading monooxygenase HmoA